ncbi:hypothetical protein FQN60_003370, partial [Etheostoma spectabile]
MQRDVCCNNFKVCVFSLQFKRFHREIIIELEKKTEMDVKYMNATYKRYQSEHKLKQDSLERSQTDLKKLRRKSQGKHSSKYEIKENEMTLVEYIGNKANHPSFLIIMRSGAASDELSHVFLLSHLWLRVRQCEDGKSRALVQRLTGYHRERKRPDSRGGSSTEPLETGCFTYVETISSRQVDMQKFIADGCREALLEEKRRFCFLADKHCMFSYQTSNFHEKAKEMLSVKLPSWQEKCSEITKVPDTVATMIEELTTTPKHSPLVERYNRNNVESGAPPPAPPLKAQTSPLANMFDPETRFSLTPPSDHNSDQGSLGEVSLSQSTSQSSGLNVGRKPRVRTIFPHTAGNNHTLLSFDDGDIITLLLQEEKDGWLYGELEKTQQRGWFPSSYCRPYTEPMISNSNLGTLAHSLSVASLPEQDEEEPVLLPPPDYSDYALS